jgi:hypothetical protein
MDDSKVRARVFDVIRRFLDVDDAPKSTNKDVRRDWLAPPPKASFKGIDPIFLYGTDEDWFFNPHDCTPDVLWPVDVSLIVEDSYSDNGIGLSIQRLRAVTAKDVRGYARRVSKFMLRRDTYAEIDGRMFGGSGLMSYLGAEWIDAENKTFWLRGDIPTKSFGKAGLAVERQAGNLAVALALRQRYEWAVNIGFENTPTVRIVTDPTGLKELFKDREPIPSKDRKDALMTWVTDHWRQLRYDPETEGYVRKFIRGTTKFSWRGFQCEIKPAAYDMERIEKLKQERAEMRAQGIDRRPAHYA